MVLGVSVMVAGVSLLMGGGASVDSFTVAGFVAGFVVGFLLTSFSSLTARLGLRNRPPSLLEGVDFCLVSPSITSLSEPTSAIRSFFPLKVPKNDVRRLSLTASGVVAVAVEVVP